MQRSMNVFLILAILLTACGQTMVITATPSDSMNPAQTSSRTQQPSATSASPTQTPVSTTDFGSQPKGEAQDYRLKENSTEIVWELARKNPDFFQQVYPDFDSDDPVINFGLSRITLLKETIARGDEASIVEAEELLANPETTGYQTDSINHKDIEPFKKLFEDALNGSGQEFTPTTDSIQNLITKTFAFENSVVLEFFPADNLLGDGSQTWVLNFSEGGLSYGIILAITRDQQGLYHVISLDKDWYKYSWSERHLSITDLNNNGIPEIAVHESWWGIGMSYFCLEELSLYEWKQDSFINLSPDLTIDVDTTVGNCGQFDFIQGSDGTQIITSYTTLETICSVGEDSLRNKLVIQNQYQWDGQIFRLSQAKVLPFENSMPDVDTLTSCALDWANKAGVTNNQAFQILTNYVLSEDDTYQDNFIKYWGPSYRDYLVFKLGIWNAIRGNKSQAISYLNNVINHPESNAFSTVPQFAKAFLSEYPSIGPYAGCLAANHLSNIGSDGSSYLSYGDTSDLYDNWGIGDNLWFYNESYDWFSGFEKKSDYINLCSLHDAFSLSITEKPFTTTNQLTEWLQDQTIPYTGLQEGDFDGNGTQDWILFAGTGEGQTMELWVLLGQTDGVHPVWLLNLYENSENITVLWTGFQSFDGNDHINIYQWSDDLIVFSINQQSNPESVEILFDAAIADRRHATLGFSISPASEKSSTQINIWNDIGEEQTIGINHQTQTYEIFYSSQLNQNQQIDGIEKAIFSDRDPKKAIDLISKMTKIDEYSYGSVFDIIEPYEDEGWSAYIEPYLRYLLGLAYEMDGQIDLAVETYWSLWDQFPENPFAYVVQQKLEPIQ